MTLWIIWALVVSTLFGLAAHIGESAMRGIRRQGRWVWVMAILGSTLLPVWSLVPSRAPPTVVEPMGSGSAYVGLDRAVSSLWVDIDAVVAPMFDQKFDERLDTYLIALWLTASTILLTGIFAGSWRLRAKAGTWPRRHVAGHDVLVSEDFGPAVFGVRSPFIVVPRWLLDHGEDTVRLVCMHEAEHRAARDTALLTGAAIVAAAMPWNVALWWQVRRLRAAVELDCDERVIEAGAPRTTYARVLLSLSAGADSYGLVMPRFSQAATLLERRLTMLITRPGKGGQARTVASLVAVAGLTVLGCRMPAPADPPAPRPSVVSDSPPPVDTDLPTMDVLVDRHTGPWVRFDGVLVPQAYPPLFFIDDVRVEEAEMRALDEDDVYSIEVLQGTRATQRYGPEALGRVISVVTKRGPVIERALAVGGPVALLYIDGVRVQGVDFRALDPSEIESIEIIKGSAATTRFGPEAIGGVVTVVTNRN